MNTNISFPDKERGKGCDILIKYKDRGCKDSYAVVEVKSCNLNRDDFSKANKQFETTTHDYRINKEPIKIILHEGKRCKTKSLFVEGIKSHNIKLIYLDGIEKTDSSRDTLYDLIIEAYRKWKNSHKNKQI